MKTILFTSDIGNFNLSLQKQIYLVTGRKAGKAIELKRFDEIEADETKTLLEEYGWAVSVVRESVLALSMAQLIKGRV